MSGTGAKASQLRFEFEGRTLKAEDTPDGATTHGTLCGCVPPRLRRHRCAISRQSWLAGFSCERHRLIGVVA
jgi:hypothetical protein